MSRLFSIRIWSILALVVLTVFFTSCEQTEEANNSPVLKAGEEIQIPAAPPNVNEIVPASPLVFHLDNYCDAFEVEFNGTVAGGTEIGCIGGLLAGNFGFNFGSLPFDDKPGFGLGLSSYNNDPMIEAFFLFDFKDMTWGLYASEGGAPFLANQGTFSMGPPLQEHSKLPRALDVRK